MAALRGPPPSPPRIEALSRLDDLEELAERFFAQSGYEPELLSHWDPKLEFQLEIEGWIAAAARPSLVPYTYSSYLDLNDCALKSKLCETPARRLLVTASGTTSVATVVAFVHGLCIQKMLVVTPAYFSVEALCDNLGIAVEYVPVLREAGRYRLPMLPNALANGVVWLTLPIFGTSCYLDVREIGAWIDALPPGMLVVVDESLAYIDSASLSRTKSMERVIRILTPNKALCVNGEKVSFIAAPAAYIDALNDWTECLAGGIGTSGLRALRFFQDGAFDEAVKHSRVLLATLKCRLESVLNGLRACVRDTETDGHFVMLYWPTLPMARLNDADFMMRVMSETGAFVIPASRNRHPDAYGSAFRVNLLRLDNAGLGALRRLALFFEALASERVSL